MSIARERPHAALTATEISADALAVARRNARRLGVADRIAFVEAGLFAGLTGAFDLVVSNPPYVAERDRPTIQPEVGRFEPGRALFAGADGLDAIRRLVADAPSHLAPGGHVAFEFGFGQSERVADLMSCAPELTLVEIRPDLQAIPRICVGRKS